MPAPSQPELIIIAEAFHGSGCVQAVEPLGNGNVNDTYLVHAVDGPTVLQRINTQVFTQPQLVMQNLQVLGDHIDRKLHSAAAHPLLEQRRCHYTLHWFGLIKESSSVV